MKRSRFTCLMICLLFGLSACTPKLDAPELTSGRANFSTVVALGGNTMAGYQDGALYREGQEASLANLVAEQIALLSGETAAAFEQPLLPGGDVSLGLNPKPWESLLQKRSNLGTRVDCENVESLGPVKDSLSIAEANAGAWAQYNGTAVNNMSVPFAGLWYLDDNDLAANPLNGGPAVFYSRFPDLSVSPLEAALRQEPTFLMMWPGMQDIYNWAATGGTSNLPDAGAFRVTLDSILQAATANGAKGVLANIPDIRTIPYFTTIPSQSLELSAALADSLNGIYALGNIDIGFEEGANGFVVADAASADGFRQLAPDEYLTLTAPLDSMRCFLYGVLFQLIGDQYSLISSELTALRSRVAELNAIVADLAQQYDFALVDAAAFYDRLNAGFVYDAVDFNGEFVSGGYFSLDGYHPHPKGSGLLANEFILAINAHYDATIPTVRIDALRGVLFP